MYLKYSLALTSLLLAVVHIQAAEEASADLSGTYTGTYDWTDMPPKAYAGKTTSMVLTKTEKGYQATFKAAFQTAKFEGFKEAKDYDYMGELVLDPSKTFLTGKIYEPDKKRFWVVDLKIQKNRAIGFAKELAGYKTWGTFNLSKQDPKEP